MKERYTAATVHVDDMEPRAFQAFLSFVYTNSLPEMKKEKEDAIPAPAPTILTLAEQHNCGGLKKACLDFVTDPANLKAVVASDGFEHLSKSCPFVNKKLILMLAS
ncbi:hypothetical protein PR202_ga00248 [Eleusine coracana subsp. coracana]|uniref:BPM/SPOP BACK domain-containing protein n=1 Tax=Eleusine coracana subsp. coracana TaxID=191504 RepID=A0AAV5BFZ0_ELECO|nr:hypothetical protein PR202_ga00248 [Eleusine coracana subsp. coracana]